MFDNDAIRLIIEFIGGYISFEIYMAIHQAIIHHKNKRD